MYSKKDLLDKVNEFLNVSSETECIEFKEAKDNFDFEKLGKYFSALSNEANLNSHLCGWLVFGISDEKPRKIVGTNFRGKKEHLGSLKQEVANQTNGITFQTINEIFVKEKRVLLFQIPPALSGIPTSWKGHYFGRNGESLTALGSEKLERIRYQMGAHDWSAQICPEATIDDLDPKALEIAHAKFENKYSNDRFDKELDIVTFLNKARITRNGKITRTAILLLGKPEAAHHLNPHPAQITWKLDTEEEGYAHFGPPFFISVEQAYQHIRNTKFRFQPRNRLIPIELDKYDPKIILEALNNCIAHQDYTQLSRIIIIERIDQLILKNIGGFYDGKVDDYVLRERTPERYRNPFLVQAMVNLDMIDTMGMGIRRMFLQQRKRFFPLPEYNLEDPNRVELKIFGKLIDENYSRTLIENKDLSIEEVVALDHIQKKRKIDKGILRVLKKKKLIEGRYPNIFVSATVAVNTNQRAKYIKNKGLDDHHYEKMILKLINQYGSASREDVDGLIIDKLPEILDVKQKKDKVGNLLSKMKKKGLIVNQGSGKQSKWVRDKN